MGKLSKIIHFYDDGTFKEFKSQEIKESVPFTPAHTQLGYKVNYAGYMSNSLPTIPKHTPFCSQCGVPTSDAQLFDSCPHRDCPVEKISRR